MGGDLAADKTDLQVAVANGDRVRVVWVVRLALEFELAADAKTGDDVLAAFERDADEFAVEDRRIADGRIRIAQVAVAGGKDALDERVAFVRQAARRLLLGTARSRRAPRRRARTQPPTALGAAAPPEVLYGLVSGSCSCSASSPAGGACSCCGSKPSRLSVMASWP